MHYLRNSSIRMGEFLSAVFPVLLQVMQVTERFDKDRDGMIENSG